MVYAALSSGIGVGSFAMGALREQVPLARLYAGSAAYPLACALLVVFVRHRLEQPLPLTAFPDRQ
jgi:predicted MFS family arabinose efflux permease